MPERIEHKPLDEWVRMRLAWAVKSLAEALGNRADAPAYQFINPARQALHNLTEFFGSLHPLDLTEADADLSSNLHTWLRKCEDTPESVILYRLIDERRGLSTGWPLLRRYEQVGAYKLPLKPQVRSLTPAHRTTLSCLPP
jgi:hypothetical protein